MPKRTTTDIEDDALDALARFTSGCAKQVHDITHGQALVVAWPDGLAEARAAAWGNVAGFATLIRTALVVALAEPRPDKCENCAKAWDALQLAKLALTDAGGACH